MEEDFIRSSDYDRTIVQVADEAYNDFKAGHNNEHKYKNSFVEFGPGIWDRESLHSVYLKAWNAAKAKAEDNTGKILGKIDLSKIRR